MTEGLRRLEFVGTNARTLESSEPRTVSRAPLERPAQTARLAPIALLSLLIAACGDGLNLPEPEGGNGSEPPVGATNAAGVASVDTPPGEDVPATTGTTLTGYVIDGPVAGADVTIRDASGQELATGRSDDQARFTIELPDDIDYPLSIHASGGINATTGEDPGFALSGIVAASDQTHVVLSSLSSLVMQRAECGADTRGESVATSHLQVAEDISTAADPLLAYGFGLTTAQRTELLTASPSTPADAAGLLLASEAMAESLRRAAAASGSSVADTLWAVACALVEDRPEEPADSGSAQQIAAFHTAATAVQLETARGRLQIAENGSDAITLLEDAVTATFELDAGQTIDALPLTEEFRAELLRQANTALATAPSTELFELYDQVLALTGDESRGEIDERLEAIEFTARLDELLAEVVADASLASQLNESASADPLEVPPPSLTFTASPRQLGARGTESTTLSYDAENATACIRVADGLEGWSGTHGTAGEEEIGPIEQVTTFSLRCTGPGGMIEESVEVTVPSAVETAWTNASGDTATSFEPGEMVRLEIASSNEDTCEVRRSDTGDVVTGELKADVSLSVTVSCEGPGGTSLVTQSVPVRAARLVWEAPTQRTDGSPLTSLAGFRIYHGTSSGNYDGDPITIGDPTRDSHTESFPSGPRYFTMIAIDPDGREGERAAEVFKEIP